MWLFTRIEEGSSPELTLDRPVCIIKKVPDAQRLFCIFGAIVEKPYRNDTDSSFQYTQ